MVYIGIVLAKIVEITIMTVRIVLITKGERKIGSIIAFFEVTLWLIIVSQVLDGIAEDPFKIVAYATGFSIGNYLGSLAEEKLGIGTAEVECILKESDSQNVIDNIRKNGYAVTVVPAQGMNDPKALLIMYTKRKEVKKLVNLIMETESKAVITVSERKPVYGGFGMVLKK